MAQPLQTACRSLTAAILRLHVAVCLPQSQGFPNDKLSALFSIIKAVHDRSTAERLQVHGVLGSQG